ncbi:hypothetical protein C8J57DRAFT_1707636 [Mycena rebaudengoi]|nr:hypothetical protein C8J57DRAFT_1707636 [Mycena rebaudengoi]
MRFSVFALVSLLSILSSSVSATSTPAARSPTGINPPRSVLSSDANGDAIRRTVTSRKYMSNALRLARGLPLNPPHRGKGSHARKSTLPPTTVSGYIFVSSLGYVSPQLNDFGELGYFLPSKTGAMKVALTYYADQPSTPLNIRVIGGSYFLGGISGYNSPSDDLVAGKPNYNFLGYTTETPVNSLPTAGNNSFTQTTGIFENIESAIWNFNVGTGALTPRWINVDSSAPADISIFYAEEEPVLGLTGDMTTFYNNFGVGTKVSFRFIAI